MAGNLTQVELDSKRQKRMAAFFGGARNAAIMPVEEWEVRLHGEESFTLDDFLKHPDSLFDWRMHDIRCIERVADCITR